MKIESHRDKHTLELRDISKSPASNWLRLLAVQLEGHPGGSVGVYSNLNEAFVLGDLQVVGKRCRRLDGTRLPPPLSPKCSYFSEKYTQGQLRSTWDVYSPSLSSGHWLYLSNVVGKARVIAELNAVDETFILLNNHRGCLEGRFVFAYYSPCETAQIAVFALARDESNHIKIVLTSDGGRAVLTSNGRSETLKRWEQPYMQANAWTHVSLRMEEKRIVLQAGGKGQIKLLSVQSR